MKEGDIHHAPRRIINVSNRLPVKLAQAEEGLSYTTSEGGLATGLSALFARYESLWIGWPGAEVAAENMAQVSVDLRSQKLAPVFLNAEEIEGYYEGFSNETIWPLFHYFPSKSGFDAHFYECYEQVNRKFADAVIQEAKTNDIIWIHDYQLMLVPQMLRAAFPELTIGFFLHIPFPAYPVFMALPWRKDILEGLMGADVLGFQTYDDVHNFTDSANRVLEVNFVGNEVKAGERTVLAHAFPISIDYRKFQELSESKEVLSASKTLHTLLRGNKLAISVDRLDYSKGIIQRLQAYELFLNLHPEWLGKISYFHLVVPSRDQVRNYRELKEEMDKLISSINGRHATFDWLPIHHFYRSLPPEQLVAMYREADIAWVTPLRDGMNLVSKEFVACNSGRNGVLVLSEMAGASRELNDALVVNPNDTEAFAQIIFEALNMPAEERKQRMKHMRQIVKQADIFKWADDFMEALEEVKSRVLPPSARPFNSIVLERIEAKYCCAEHRLLLLDYDGTLVPFYDQPDAARPDDALLHLLACIAGEPANRLAIISGRDRHTLERWLGHLPLDLIAEHGAWYRVQGGEWESRHDADGSWKTKYIHKLNGFTRATPGALIEEKSYSIVWHYRQCDPFLAQRRVAEIRNALEKNAQAEGLQLLDGNKVLEIRNPAINKGRATRRWLHSEPYDFILAAGDDTTDEDMFKALPTGSVSLRVGSKRSAASFFVKDYKALRRILEQLHHSGFPPNHHSSPVNITAC
ncbi:MAG: bifunctional alpha,alpha-trehalose-phosphate synthase (UDP-forming)/trehalose-phosphatase [Bacteroidetes bacterium]|nr:bifunctional alpha,alpha-trehalose-phosphate synthase (UDP-forming)/trehalose-phosphatase [Bacteroidota bacterium]MBS1630700.1 bifunctional alpha,alpha-trehalose-phosphate synthase (UDP-forming)/trehalose-phosphatase [Bacteroidota bacterium]